MIRKGLFFCVLVLIAGLAVGCGTAGLFGHSREVTIDLGQGFVIEMVRIEPGEFDMGSPVTEQGRYDDEQLHRVRISKPFLMARHQVTQALWQRMMGEHQPAFPNAQGPVETVSYEDCQEFLARLNRAVPGGGFRLPTEAEWEYACRAGTTTRFNFGEDEAELADYAWCGQNSGGKTHEVGTRKPNPWGLYDMNGNVCEWCQDWYGEYGAPGKGALEDPTGPAEGTQRVLRGGSWRNEARICRSAFRTKGYPTYRHPIYGLRLARDAE